tara:strand:- start:12 stop:488 length:477 start_codon:yes stop_codon:yes gene_type:complete
MAYKVPQTQTKMSANHTQNKSFVLEQTEQSQKELVNTKLKKVFKNAKRHKNVRWGWVKLTRDGVVDSMTADERAYDDENIQTNRTNNTVMEMYERCQRYKNEKFERDGYLSDEICEESYSDEEVDDMYDESEEELEDEELDLENRKYEDPIMKKWNTS